MCQKWMYCHWKVDIKGRVIECGCNGEVVSCVSGCGFFWAVLYLPPVCMSDGGWYWGCSCVFLEDWEVLCVVMDMVAMV